MLKVTILPNVVFGWAYSRENKAQRSSEPLWVNPRPPYWSFSLHHWMALLLFPHHPILTLPLLPSMHPFLSRPFPCLLILWRRKIRIAREHNKDYQINIGHNLFLLSLLHGLSPVSLSSPPLSLTRSLWLISLFTLCPSSLLLLLGV